MKKARTARRSDQRSARGRCVRCRHPRLPVEGSCRPSPVAGYSWTGCYVGAGGGYGMFNQETQTSRYARRPVGLSNDNGGRGWFGTVQVGCDYQIGSNIVIGAFGDYDFSGIKGDMVQSRFQRLGPRREEKLKNSWAAGGRIGWIPFQASQLLVYRVGRLHAGAVRRRSTSVHPRPCADRCRRFAKHTYAGWFVGAGYEYGLGFLPGLFWKTEYRFADYGVRQHLRAGRRGRDDRFGSSQRKYVHTVRSELVWRFNFGGPVVARY